MGSTLRSLGSTWGVLDAAGIHRGGFGSDLGRFRMGLDPSFCRMLDPFLGSNGFVRFAFASLSLRVAAASI